MSAGREKEYINKDIYQDKDPKTREWWSKTLNRLGRIILQSSWQGSLRPPSGPFGPYIDSYTMMTFILYWLLYNDESYTILTLIQWWKLYYNDSYTMMELILYWLLYNDESYTILTLILWWNLYYIDSYTMMELILYWLLYNVYYFDIHASIQFNEHNIMMKLRVDSMLFRCKGYQPKVMTNRNGITCNNHLPHRKLLAWYLVITHIANRDNFISRNTCTLQCNKLWNII